MPCAHDTGELAQKGSVGNQRTTSSRHESVGGLHTRLTKFKLCVTYLM